MRTLISPCMDRRHSYMYTRVQAWHDQPCKEPLGAIGVASSWKLLGDHGRNGFSDALTAKQPHWIIAPKVPIYTSDMGRRITFTGYADIRGRQPQRVPLQRPESNGCVWQAGPPFVSDNRGSNCILGTGLSIQCYPQKHSHMNAPHWTWWPKARFPE